MPDFRFVCAKPEALPSSGYALRISHSSWSQYEDLIRLLHECGSTRDDILRNLANEHAFQPSAGQLRDQMARWGLRSLRKSRAKVTMLGQDDFSGESSVSGSDGLLNTQICQQMPSVPQVYNDVPDSSFDAMWTRYDMGVLPYQTAVEMEVLADTLFLGGRYVAAFSLYSSIYSALSASHRRNNDYAAAKFRAFLGCLRSCGNGEQRHQIVSMSEAELQRCFQGNCCKLDEIDLRKGSDRFRSPMMTQFDKRESFRYAMSAVGNTSTVSDVVMRLQMAEGREALLDWCFERLNTFKFISLYNDHLQRSGSGVACWMYGGAQAVIYWFLVVCTMEEKHNSVPELSIRHLTGHKYTLSVCESFALVAAIISSEPWLFSLDRLPPDGLRKWTETLVKNETLFDSLFQEAVRTTLVPTFTMRINKSNSDALACANGYPAYRMPNMSCLKTLANELAGLNRDSTPSLNDHDGMNLDIQSPAVSHQSVFEHLTRDYSDIIRNYISENCAYGTSYQLREEPKVPLPNAHTSVSNQSTPVHLRPLSGRAYLKSSCDPPLVPSAGVSMEGSFQSFESTHKRTKQKTVKVSELDPMSIDTSIGSTNSRQVRPSIGVK